jgi:biopolymer transport protein ExbD
MVSVSASVSRNVVMVVAALATGCFVASPVMHFGGGKSAKQVQYETVRELTPPTLAPSGAWQGEVRTAAIRVWADDDYRAQNGQWKETFQRVVDDANDVLAGDFGVRLVPEYRSWDRHAPIASLTDGLAALAAQDRGDDVIAVVGLTSSTPLTSGTFEQIGYAETPGRHLIVRGYADLEERAAFDRAFDDVGEVERAEMYEARRRHRNAALLLHELGHTLGAPHRTEPDTIMSAVYSIKSTSFDETSRSLIRATLDDRLHRAPAATPGDGATGGLVISIDDHGRVIVGGNALGTSTFDDLLTLYAKNDPDIDVVVRVDPAAQAGWVENVVAHVRGAGLGHVRVVPR